MLIYGYKYQNNNSFHNNSCSFVSSRPQRIAYEWQFWRKEEYERNLSLVQLLSPNYFTHVLKLILLADKNAWLRFSIQTREDKFTILKNDVFLKIALKSKLLKEIILKVFLHLKRLSFCLVFVTNLFLWDAVLLNLINQWMNSGEIRFLLEKEKKHKEYYYFNAVCCIIMTTLQYFIKCKLSAL